MCFLWDTVEHPNLPELMEGQHVHQCPIASDATASKCQKAIVRDVMKMMMMMMSGKRGSSVGSRGTR